MSACTCAASSSAFLLASCADAVRNQIEEESTSSAALPAKTGMGRHTSVRAPRRRGPPLRSGHLRQKRQPRPWRRSSVPVERRASLAPPPPCRLSRRSSVPVASERHAPPSRVMKGCSHLPCDSLPRVSKPRAQPPLTPPSSGTRATSHGGQQQETNCWSTTLLLVNLECSCSGGGGGVVMVGDGGEGRRGRGKGEGGGGGGEASVCVCCVL